MFKMYTILVFIAKPTASESVYLMHGDLIQYKLKNIPDGLLVYSLSQTYNIYLH